MNNVFRIYIRFLSYLATNLIIRILLSKREPVLLRHLWVLRTAIFNDILNLKRDNIKSLKQVP